jgi:hypothetical protein
LWLGSTSGSFEVFACGAILGRSGHHLVVHMSKNWGGYSQRKPLFNNLLHWPPPTSPNLIRQQRMPPGLIEGSSYRMKDRIES